MKKTEHGNVNPLIILLIIIAAAIPLTVIVSQKQQEIRQRAAESQSIPSSQCRPPYEGYLGCLTENGCNNVGISSNVSCKDENVQIGVYCYKSTKKGQACSESGSSGSCDDNGNCLISSLPAPISPPAATPISNPTSQPTATPIPPTSIPRCVQNYGDDCGFNGEGFIDCTGRCVLPNPTSVPASTPSPKPTLTPTPTNTPTPKPTSTPSPSRIPTLFPTATSAPRPTPTPTPIPARTPTTTSTVTPFPTFAPKPTSTPPPASTPAIATAIRGDVDRDGCVGIIDARVWLTAFQTGVIRLGTQPDISGPNGVPDGIVDILDINGWRIAMEKGEKLCQ